MLKAKDEIIVDDEIVLKRFTHDVDHRKPRASLTVVAMGKIL